MSTDIQKIKNNIRELESCHDALKKQVHMLGTVMQALASSCADEPELLQVMNQESRYLRSLRGIVDEFSIVRQVKRRLPQIEREARQKKSDATTETLNLQRHAEGVRESLDTLLKQFLNG